MKLGHINKRLVVFSVIGLAFLVALSYAVSVAWKSRGAMQAKQNQTQELINNILQ